MKKLLDFKVLDEPIQEYADEYCEGNFSQAARHLMRMGLQYHTNAEANETNLTRIT